jgi:G3E family GTPase
MAETTPVTVLTGFLGAGKTTVLNHLLRQPALARTAVLVNEFGVIGIDHLLVEKLDENTVLLNAGCLCCTVRGDLVRTLREMLPRARRDEISRIVIETTGLAEPAPILATLMTDPAVASAYRLDGVVTVIDAVAGATNLAERPEAVRQIAVADRIVLTKTDLADPTSLLRRIEALNPGAPVIAARHGAIDPATILNAGLFNPATKIPDVAGWLRAEAHAGRHHHSNGQAPDGHEPDGHEPNGHEHDERVTSFCLTFDRPLHWQGVGLWLEMLIQTRGKDLLRIKGILNLLGQDRPVVIHAVQHVLHPPALLSAWPEGDPRTSRIVFITQDLPRAVIEDGMHAFEAAATG